uniref:Uncharacterized protein n=1 Tax=Leersia perrieri TaxID=77586 RepID=A0A0D9WXZ0_9ORYZ
MRTPSLPIRLMHNVWRGVADTLLVVLLAVVVGGGGATGQKPCPQQLCFYCGCSAVQTETSAMQDSLSVTLTVSDGRLLGGCVAGMPMEPAVEDCDSEGGSCARREGEVDHLASLEAMMRDEQPEFGCVSTINYATWERCSLPVDESEVCFYYSPSF